MQVGTSIYRPTVLGRLALITGFKPSWLDFRALTGESARALANVMLRHTDAPVCGLRLTFLESRFLAMAMIGNGILDPDHQAGMSSVLATFRRV